MENVITEFRVIETEDGFRVEIKGDKEKIKTFMGDFCGHKGRRGRGRRYGWGPWAHGFNPMMWMKMASCWESWDYEGESEAEADEAKQV